MAIDANERPKVQDHRPTLIGVLPRNTQNLVLGGIALLMILVILFSGHNAPKQKPPVITPGTAVNDPNLPRIQDYRARIEEQMRKLAAEEAELAQAKQAIVQPALRQPTFGEPFHSQPSIPARTYGNTPTPTPGERETSDQSIERDREKRAYQSLFASNVALSYRREPAEAAAPKTPATHPTQQHPETPGQSYRLFEGTILETVLTNRLDSSFSGPVNCMVTTNVYSHDGQKLLIPQGSRVLGEVKKLESFGEQRLAVMFHRIIMPDGYSVNLDQFKGLDQIGETGLLDHVNHHYFQVFGVSIALGALAGLSQSNTRYSLDESALDAYRQGVSSNVSQSAMHVLDRYLNVLPTFTIREGYRIKVYLSQDLMLPAYEEHPVRNDL